MLAFYDDFAIVASLWKFKKIALLGKVITFQNQTHLVNKEANYQGAAQNL